MKVKSLAQAQANFKSGASVAGARYKAAVEATSDEDVKRASIEGQANYEAQMRDPSVLARRKSGVERGESWKAGALSKGASSIGPNMQRADGKWAKNTSPHLEVLAGLSLAPRGTDSDANIDARVKPIARALRAKKEQLKG